MPTHTAVSTEAHARLARATRSHAEALAELAQVVPGLETRGFAHAIRRLLDGKNGPGFVPDAYQVDRDHRTLRLWEIELHHPIPDAKMDRIAWLWFLLDCEEWALELYRTTPGLVPMDPVDLMSHYHRMARCSTTA